MKKILVVTCTSFTTIVLLFVLCSPFDIVPAASNSILLQLFAMSLTIAIFMVLADILEEVKDISSFTADIVIRIIICYLVVMIEGHFFGMLKFGWKSLLEITPVLIPTIITTYIVSIFFFIEFASRINDTIHHRHGKERKTL